MNDAVTQIYETLTKRRYNRGEPNLKNEIERSILRFVEGNEAIQLVGFWGTGPKREPNWADSSSCEFLAELNREIQRVYSKGIEFTFIFATLHGVHNGYEKDAIVSYTKGMETVFRQFGFNYRYLEELWEKYGISFEKINQEWGLKPEGWWDQVENKETIERNAKNRNRTLLPIPAAQKYFIMRELEKQMLEKEFSGYIFHAFSDPSLKNVLPHMPTLYFYARAGWSDTPWFVTRSES